MTAAKQSPPEKQEPPAGKRTARRRPGRFRRWLLRPLVWVLAILLGLVGIALLYLSSDAFEVRIEALIEERASETLGRAVTLENLDLSILSLGAEAHDLRIAGPGPDDPPVLTARRVAVDLSVVELVLRGPGRTAIRLDQVVLEEPRFELRFDPNGESNLPEFPSGGEGGSIEVEMGRLLVQEGAFVYEEQRVPMEIDAREVWGQLDGGAFDEGSPFRIRLTASSLDTRLPGTEPFAPAVSLDVRLFPDHLELVRGRLEADEFEADLSGPIRWGEAAEGATGAAEASMSVHLDIEARASADWANRLGYLDEPVEGPVRFDGRFDWTEDVWRYAGDVTADWLATLDRRFEDVRAEVAGGAEQVQVDVASARHAGGVLQGTLKLDLAQTDAAGGWEARIEARGQGLSLRALLDPLGIELSQAAGQVDARLGYRFSTAAFRRGDGTGRVAVSDLRRPTDRLAVRGQAAFEVQDGLLRVHGGRLATSQQAVTADLTYDLDRGFGAARWRLETSDLAELASLLFEDWKTGPEGTPIWWPEGGSGVLGGTLEMDPTRVVGRAGFELTDVSTRDLSVEVLEGTVEHSPERISGLEVRLERGAGELWITGGVALPAAEGTPVGLDLEVGVAGWSIATLEPWLPAASSVDGALNGRLDLQGTFEELALTGSLWAEPLQVAEIRFDRAEVDLAWNGSEGRIDRLLVTGPPGELAGYGSLDLASGSVQARLDVPALDFAASETAGGLAARLEGILTASAEVTGTLDDPAAELTLSARDLALDGQALGRAGVAELTATWTQEGFEGAGSLLGLVYFDGGGRLDREQVDLSFAVESERIGEILDLFVEPEPDLTGRFAGVLTVGGSLQDLEALAGRVELSELILIRGEHEIRNLQPVIAELGTRALEVESLFLGDPETESEMFVAGTLGLRKEDYPLDLQIQASLDSVWLAPLLPQFQIDGSIDALATVRGNVAAPRINGQGAIRRGRAIVPGFPHALDDLSAVVFFYPQQVVLHELTGRFASGRVRATGRMDMPRADEPLVYELQAEARNLSVRYPEGWTMRGDGELSLRAPVAGGRELSGTVRLNRAFYVQDLQIGVLQLLQLALRRQRLVLQETDEVLASTHLSLAIEGPGALRVRNNVADLSGDLSLSLHGTLARPVVFGRVEVERGGTLVFRDTEYEVASGLVTFANPYEIEPVIDLVATTEVRRYDVQLNLSGTLDRLNADFTSNPPLADLEILGLITTGAAPGEAIAQGQVAERFLYGQAASAISRRVNTLFGFDRFRISPGEQLGSGIGFAVEKQISRDVRVIFSRDPTSTEREILQVAWDLSDEVTLILTREGDGSFALDTRWERSF